MVSTHSGIHKDTKRKGIRMKTKTVSVYGIGKILNNFNSYIRTFNPLAAGSIPARPTRKKKGFRQLDGSLFLLAPVRKSTKVYVLGCVVALLALGSGCGGGGEEGGFVYVPEPSAPTYVETVTEWTVIGDSSGNDFASRWPGEVTNYARNGARIDLFLNHPPPNVFQKVILMIGGNNVGLNNESVDTVVEKYALLYWSIKADRVFCVGISPFASGKPEFSPLKNPRIQEINEHIKGMCENYIDTWPPAMTPSFTDGVHHTEDYDWQIRMSILGR